MKVKLQTSRKLGEMDGAIRLLRQSGGLDDTAVEVTEVRDSAERLQGYEFSLTVAADGDVAADDDDADEPGAED